MSKQEEIKQALAAATPGSWEWQVNKRVFNNGECQDGEFCVGDLQVRERDKLYGSIIDVQKNKYGQPAIYCWNESDANLIAKAPEYIAYLLEALEEAREEISSLNSDVIELHKLIGADALEKELKVIKEKNKQETDWRKLYLESERSKKLLSDYLNELMYKTPNETIASQIANVLREALGQEGEGNQDEKA